MTILKQCILLVVFAMVLFTCKKSDTLIPEETPVKIFKYPLYLKPYKIEIVDSVKVYVKTGYQMKQQIQQYSPDLLNHEVFNHLGEKVITALTFESADWAKYDPPVINDRMQVTKNGNAFTFSVTIGSNTSCHATGSGDYDDLYIDCQAFNRRSSVPVLSGGFDGFLDPCTPQTALDCANGDTIAIVNYRVHLKKI